MRTLRLGPTELYVPRIGYGCLSLGGDGTLSPSETLERATRALEAALECGITFFDHADIYRGGESERVFGQALAELGVQRDAVVIQSKCGIRLASNGAPHRYDHSYEHIVSSVEQSLRRLGTEYLDVLLLHRPDPLVEPEEVARAFDALRSSGKVRHFGVSNYTATQIELLCRALSRPLVANQLELSLARSELIDAGITMNRGRPSTGTDGLLDYCRLEGITIQAWSPLGRGRALGGDADERARGLLRAVSRLAALKGVEPEAIPIAWLLRHPAQLLPIIGTANPARIRAAASADGVELTREEWYELYTKARGERLP